MAPNPKSINALTADIIDGVLTGRIETINQFNVLVDQLGSIAADCEASMQLHQIMHFFADEDLRKRDKGYDELQRAALVQAARELRGHT